ncbi:MAG: hypothetical protein QMB52_01215 [Propionivibrio sp.]
MERIDEIGSWDRRKFILSGYRVRKLEKCSQNPVFRSFQGRNASCAGGVIGNPFGSGDALVVVMPKLLQQCRIVVGIMGEPMMHADVCLDFGDASLDDPIFIGARIRAQEALQKGQRAREGEDIQANSVSIRLMRPAMTDVLFPDVAEGIGDVSIAGAAFVERGDQLSNAILNIRHVICPVYETGRAS